MDILTDVKQLMEPRILLIFSAEWCPPCKLLAPLLAFFEPKFPTIKFLKVDQEHELAEQFNITSIPTMVVLYGGREVRRISGSMNRIALEQWLNLSV